MIREIVVDIDGVLCTDTRGAYERAKPIQDAIDVMNRARRAGHRVVVHTARYMNRYCGYAAAIEACRKRETADQLREWGLEFDALIFGKPPCDISLDDTSVFWIPDWPEIERRINK